jgi:hypothetical protein
VTADQLGRQESWFHAVSFHTVLAALCPLVPVPFVDTFLLQRVKKSMTRGLARDLRVALTEPQVAVLAGAVDLEPARGCLPGCLGASGKLGLALLKRLFTKLVFVLTFKESVEHAQEVFYEGVLLQHALTVHRSALPESGADDERQARARELRKAIDGVLGDVQTGVVRAIVAGVLRGARQALLEGARILVTAGTAPDESTPLPVAEEAKVLEGVTSRLREALWKEQETIVLLRRRLDARLA